MQKRQKEQQVVSTVRRDDQKASRDLRRRWTHRLATQSLQKTARHLQRTRPHAAHLQKSCVLRPLLEYGVDEGRQGRTGEHNQQSQ